ncbi:unnamed protein product, partial [Mesorhabditis belari]|uniref:Uncharacterized protein n=1 Tax=Mesorhabditis belari TaxID=2138241 RepID=A0AAF3J6V1_9BILA
MAWKSTKREETTGFTLCVSPTSRSYLSTGSGTSTDPLLAPLKQETTVTPARSVSETINDHSTPNSSPSLSSIRCDPSKEGRFTDYHHIDTHMCPAKGQQKTENGDENESAVNERLLDKTNRRSNGKCLRWIFSFLCFIIFLSITAAITFLIYYFFVPKTCTSIGCVSATALLYEKMDPTVSPCDDFYKYACSRWINTTISRLPLGNQWHSIAETGIHSHQTLGSTINKIRTRELSIELSEGENEVVRMFSECMDTDTLEKKGLTQWAQLIQSIGGWRLSEVIPHSSHSSHPSHSSHSSSLSGLSSSPNLFEDLILQAYGFATFPIFWIGVDVNYLNSREYIITIDEQVPILIYGLLYKTNEKELTAEDIVTGKIEQEMNILFQTGLQMATYADLDSTDVTVRESIARAMELEWNLVRISTVHEGKGKDHEKYNLTDLAELKRRVPAFDWEYFLERLLGKSISRTQPIAIKAGTHWLSQLSRILDVYTQTPKELKVIEDYIKWRILMVTMSYTMPRYQSPANFGFELIRQFYVGQTSMREEFCLARLAGHFPLSTAALMRRNAPDDAEKNKEKLKELFASVQRTYREIIEKSAILDEQTKEHILNKLSNITFMASFPDEVHNVAALNAEFDHFRSSDDEEKSDDFFWTMVRASARKYRRDLTRLGKLIPSTQWLDNTNSVTLNAVHNFERNIVVYPMALIGKHFLDHTNPGFINYAGAAFFIGHEIGHAFDIQGRHYGVTGNLGVYWSEASSNGYDENGKCFIDQYAKLKGGQKNDFIHSKVTLYENLADNLGLQAAWLAFKRENDLKGKRLPGFELTSEQAFFVKYAQNWCSIVDPQGGVHAKEQYRVIGALQNVADFAEAFSCPTTSTMNPTKRCFVL